MTSDFLTPYYPICIGLIAIGLYMFMRTMNVLDSYKLLAKNEEHTNRFSFKLRRKIRKKVDDF